MIEVTCAACGTLNRIAEGDVSPGTKFVTCASCKSRVAIPAKVGTAPVPKVPSIPAAPIPRTPPPIPGAPRRDPSADLADLPAPKRTSPLAGVQAPPRPQPTGLDAELPAPKGGAKPGASGSIPLDLDELMPATPAGLADLPAPKPKTGPVPKFSAAGLADLPAPKPKAGLQLDDDIIDLPGPKGITDLPAPKGITDLPAPKAPPGIIDLPAPKPGANNDLPAPKGFFDDLPQPAKGGGKPDLPAPKGFFDDLPQPAKGGGKPDLPAPKGFFDDLPQPAKGGGKPDLPAPKGFFDDLPQPAGDVSAKDGRELSSSDLFTPPSGSDIELGNSLSGDKPLELANSAGTLDLEPGGFKDLELAEPVKPEPKAEGPIKFKKPTGDAPRTPVAPAPVPVPKKGESLELALEDVPHADKKQQAKLAPKRAAKAAEQTAADGAKKKKQQKLLGAVLGVALVGSGGVYLFQRHVAAQHRADEIASKLKTARASIGEAAPNHWQKAAAAARGVVELDSHNSAGYGLAAEALIAGAIDNGVSYPQRIQQGRQMIAKAQEVGVTGPELDRAQALAAIAANQADRAVTKLTALTAANPKDGFLQLYLGWAQLAKGDPAAAIKAFDAAVAATPATKLAALYGRGRAKLLLADLDGAKADFAAILETDKNHIPAQVGLAAALPPAQSSQKEADLLAVLARPDIKDADPRAAVEAWTLAADVARVTGRLDVARDRYGKAIAIIPNDVRALTGLAAVELRDNKPAVAGDLIEKALAANADDVEAQLVGAEIRIKVGRLPDALALIKKLEAHQPPLPPLQQAHLMLAKGRMLEVQGQDEDAIDAYKSGAKLAGDLDLSPTMAAVELLTSLSKKSAEAHDDKKSEEYRARADQELSNFVDRAQEDPQLAMTLGTAYLQAGDAAKAEALLHRAVEMRSNDLEAKLQHGKALALLGRTDEAVGELRGALDLDPTRNDISLELARTFELANKTDEATAVYDKLTQIKTSPVIARVYAGKFYARHGNVKKAAELAGPILLEEPDNAAGHYLKGEGLLADGKLDEARTELTTASSNDPDVQYFDALGRADEASLAASKDLKFQEAAIQAYMHATQADPTWFNPWAGLGRAHVDRHEFTKSIEELDHAWKIQHDANVAYDFGMAYKTLGPKVTAIGWLEESTRIDPKRADVWYELGTLYQDSNRRGDDRKMIDALARATKLGVDDENQGKTVDWLTEAFYTLGDQYSLVHDLSGQKRAWQTYVDRKPKDQTRYTTALNALQTTLKSVP
jgi:tetratricopeptide (TPR) repeat protein